MTVSHNTIAAEGLDSFSKSPGCQTTKAAEKMAINVFKNTGGALENGAKVVVQLHQRILRQLYQLHPML